MRALEFILSTLFDLYIITFVLRFMLQWTRADFSNPLSQFIFQLTNPLVRPVRRFVPGFRGIDFSTLLIAYLLTVLASVVSNLVLGQPIVNVPGLLLGSLIALGFMFLQIMMFLIIGQVLLSWFAPYHPVSEVLRTLTAPVLRPIQKIVPPIAGIDLSPLFALLAIQAFIILLSEWM
ncbi:MAG: YggT family protein [Gammaproteobacteria bacterium]|nr:YggT family protein [Gammaproteobacteria bacterium]NNF61014.1 YggT family protein [Gammaproteobacteria bacterium]NNM21072.1 YggT family protein [Gammaproteobacteria bacterium]